MAAVDATLIANSAAEYVRRTEARKSLAKYVPFTLELEPALHHQVICEKLDSVLDGILNPEKPGRIKRLIIAAPPGHAKSTYTSYAFAAYAAARMPRGSSIIACAHTQDFADSWGRKVRNLCDTPAHKKLFPEGCPKSDDRSAKRWSTVGGVSYQAAGVGGTITGLRADILLCDDLLKGIADANSKTRREFIRDWYLSDAKTRLKPDGAIIIIATRWHEDDLTGELLRMMEEGTGESWEYLRMPALCDRPETDPTGRKMGEALWPAWLDEARLLALKNDGRSLRDWECLYQQNPVPAEGNVIKRTWIRREQLRTESPEFRALLQQSMLVISIDTANAATDRSDPSCAGTFMITPATKEYRLLDIYLEKRELPDLRRDMIDLARAVHRMFGMPPTLLIENKASGQSLKSFLDRDLPYSIILTEPKKIGDKEERFERCTPIIEAQRLIIPTEKNQPAAIISPNLPQGSNGKMWVADYIEELAMFPGARNDDQVDVTSQCLNWYESRNVRTVRRRRVRVG